MSKSKRDKAKAKSQIERKDADKPSDSKRGIRSRQLIEASHNLHNPPVYGCDKCGPAIAGQERARESRAQGPVPWANPPVMNATGVTPKGVEYRYHARLQPVETGREGD